MPELPEVETVRRALEPLLAGRRITQLSIDDPRLTRPEHPATVSERAQGHTITAVSRRGKYLLLTLDDGSVLAHHLRMTGAFLAGEQHDDPHVRARYVLDDGTTVSYRDVRRFGTLERIDRGSLTAWLHGRLGPEPLDHRLTGDELRDRLKGGHRSLKAALLDQRVVAGVGNIYADEALFAAGIRPTRQAGSLSRQESTSLLRALRAVLVAGIARGGSTLRDYARPDGSSGSMQNEFRVYGRAGQVCHRCAQPLEATRIAGRATVFCPHCQRRRKSRGKTKVTS